MQHGLADGPRRMVDAGDVKFCALEIVMALYPKAAKPGGCTPEYQEKWHLVEKIMLQRFGIRVADSPVDATQLTMTEVQAEVDSRR